MNLKKNTIRVGLEKPVRLLHVTDTHLTCVDEHDDERKHALAKRIDDPNKEKYLAEHIAYAEKTATYWCTRAI